MARTSQTPTMPERGEERHYRGATPLRPAVWMTSVLTWATVVGMFLHVPLWGSIFLCTLTGTSFLFYLVSYTYLMATDRESLRGERYRARSSNRPLCVDEDGSLGLPAELDQSRHLNPESSRSVGAVPERHARPVGVGAASHKADN